MYDVFNSNIVIWLRLNVDHIQDYRIRITPNHWYIDTDNKLDWRLDYENHKYTLILRV